MDNPESFIWLRYAVPPVVGAVIGYVTNRVAIRMLFRPLKAWYLMGVKVPMTPGVIPAKRELLAENMGEVVGEHLLTGEELGKGLRKEAFQQQLGGVIRSRLDDFLAKDLDSLSEIVPPQYQLYLNLGMIGVSQKLSGQIMEQIRSEQTAQLVEEAAAKQFARLAEQPLENLIPEDMRQKGYALIEEKLAEILSSEQTAEWIDSFVREQVYLILRENRSLTNILPQSAQELAATLIERHVPQFLSRAGVLLADEKIRAAIVGGVCDGVEEFVSSLGSIADMVRGFLSREIVAERVEAYLDAKEEDIAAWLASKEMQQKIGRMAAERSKEFLAKPLTEIVGASDEKLVADLCQAISAQIMRLLGREEVRAAFAGVCRRKVEGFFNNSNVGKDNGILGSISGGEAAVQIFGEDALKKGEAWLREQAVLFLHSSEMAEVVNGLIGGLLGGVLQKKIGRLNRFIPPQAAESIAGGIQNRLLNLAESEAPQLVQSLGIRRIVTDKINSLDLLRLERLLLSIMEEQFKYINLFGALLGFLIGCLNLLFLGV